MEPVPSWLLVGFLSAAPQQELHQQKYFIQRVFIGDLEKSSNLEKSVSSGESK